VYWHEHGGFADTPVWDRLGLAIGDRHAGPAVIEEEGSTLVVGPGANFEVLPSGNILVEMDRPERADRVDDAA
jgi:N-methylhydantoinase A